MQPAEAPVVANLHSEHIPTGFLSTLGVGFLTRLYLAVSDCRDGFVLVAVDEADRVRGFISGATDIKGVYRSVIIRHGWRCMGLLLKHTLSLASLRGLVETLLYPTRFAETLPDAELLSVVVHPDVRGSGAATSLLRELMEEFRKRGCPEFRVLVGACLERANAFYVKHGFKLTATRRSHGMPSNIYVMTTSADAHHKPQRQARDPGRRAP